MKHISGPAKWTSEEKCSKCENLFLIEEADLLRTTKWIDVQTDPPPYEVSITVWECPICYHKNEVNPGREVSVKIKKG